VELTVSMYSPLGVLRDMASTLAEKNGWGWSDVVSGRSCMDS